MDLAHDVPKLLVNVTPKVVEGVSPVVLMLAILAALLVGSAAMWYIDKRRFTGHFVV